MPLKNKVQRKADLDPKSVARSYTAVSIKTIASIMACSKVPPATRLSAAEALLNRGWGRPAQAVDIAIEDRRDGAVTDYIKQLMASETAKVIEHQAGEDVEDKGGNNP